MKTVLPVQSPSGEYAITIGRNLLADFRAISGVDAPYIVITDENVNPLYAQNFDDALAVITLPAGEEYKTLETINGVYGQLLAAGLDRKGVLVALGGGVIGDMTGFIAATYMRGVGFVQCPTSLLAMVDASVGGKTGVDLPEGKNLVGAFKQPEAVVVDLDTLSTLPVEEFACGMAETIKHGIINDPELFTFLERDSRPMSHDRPELHQMVESAVEVKRDVVQEDPFEHGRRAQLNLGHTFGHAIENVSKFEVRHGEAVAMGVMVAGRVAAALGHCDDVLPNRIESTLSLHSLPVRIPADLDVDEIIETMKSDKKKAQGVIRYILPRALGDCFITADVPRDLIAQTMNDLRQS